MAEGYLDFTAGAMLTAAQLEEYCELQGIMRFASAAARDTALNLVKTEGMFAFLKDTNCLTVYTGSAWSTLGPGHGALSAWNPVWTQSGAVTKTVTFGSVWRFGRLAFANCVLTATGAGTASNIQTIDLPYTAKGDGIPIGTGYFNDVSASNQTFQCTVKTTSSGTKAYLILPSVPGANAESVWIIGSGASATTTAVASPDVIGINVIYECTSDA